MRVLRSALLLCLLAALTFSGEWVALRGSAFLWRSVPFLRDPTVGSLGFYSICLVELALISAFIPRVARTPWLPRAGDGWGLLGLVGAAALGPIGAAVLRGTPLHWHAPASAFQFLSGGLLDPIAEEWAFRGILWRASEWAVGSSKWSRKWSPAVAGSFTSLLFGLWHLPFGSGSHGLVAIVLANAAFGLSLSLARWRFKAVGPGAIVHAMGNSFYLLTS
jgi:membrane protease YdiL (CAAX protease family)